MASFFLLRRAALSSSRAPSLTSKATALSGQCRRQSTISPAGEQPHVSDPGLKTALNRLLAVSWLNIADDMEGMVEAALSKAPGDHSGQEVVKNVWRAAAAVEEFSGTLTSLRMELDEMSGFLGENVKEVPDDVKNALDAALCRYRNYLAAFKENEAYLRKKVENELGSQFIHIRQRCSSLGPEWGDITLLGTSGLSGSYIERHGG